MPDSVLGQKSRPSPRRRNTLTWTRETEREREGNRRRRSIDGVIELICQFANYTDEFVWWPRVSLRSSIATGSAVGCLSCTMFSTRVREIGTCNARACIASLRAHVHARAYTRALQPRAQARCTDSTSWIGAPYRRGGGRSYWFSGYRDPPRTERGMYDELDFLPGARVLRQPLRDALCEK